MRRFKSYIINFFIIVLMLFDASYSHCQNDKKEEIKKARIALNYVNINNTGPRLTAIIKAKVNKVYTLLKDVKVDFYM